MAVPCDGTKWSDTHFIRGGHSVFIHHISTVLLQIVTVGIQSILSRTEAQAATHHHARATCSDRELVYSKGRCGSHRTARWVISTQETD